MHFESPYLVYFELNEIEFQIKSFKWCQEVNFISMSMKTKEHLSNGMSPH